MTPKQREHYVRKRKDVKKKGLFFRSGQLTLDQAQELAYAQKVSWKGGLTAKKNVAEEFSDG